MGLPIASQGTPPTGGTSNFGQPGGVVLGQPAGQFGAVQGTNPAQGYQNRVSPRSNVRFDVQPQVTIAVKPAIPLPDGTRRKDYLLSVRVPQTDDNRAYVNLRKTGHKGTVLCGIQQANQALKDIQDNLGNTPDSPLGMLILSGLDGEIRDGLLRSGRRDTFYYASEEEKLQRIHRTLVPFGVYNNRGTFDGQEEFQQVPNSNVGNIIGVNISNYCFMRDIWGTSLRQGDALELWYICTNGFCEIFPVSGCVEDAAGDIDEKLITHTYGNTGTIPLAVDSAKDPNRVPIYRYRLGRVWAKPIHSGFQRTVAVNIVGHDADLAANESTFGGITSPQSVYKNIEVELCSNVMM